MLQQAFYGALLIHRTQSYLSVLSNNFGDGRFTDYRPLSVYTANVEFLSAA